MLSFFQTYIVSYKFEYFYVALLLAAAEAASFSDNLMTFFRRYGRKQRLTNDGAMTADHRAVDKKPLEYYCVFWASWQSLLIYVACLEGHKLLTREGT